MLLSDIIVRIAVDLNDAAPGHEFTTWSETQLHFYVQEALDTIFNIRPDLFIETRIIKMQPCTYVQDTCDCTQIHAVIGQVTESGRLIKRLRMREQGVKQLWTGWSCPVSPKNFELREYYIDKDTDKLWVFPQVPAGTDVYLMVECSVLPDASSHSYDIPGELVPMVMQWALYRAKMVDGESNQLILTAAKEHRAVFENLLNVSMASQTMQDTSNE